MISLHRCTWQKGTAQEYVDCIFFEQFQKHIFKSVSHYSIDIILVKDIKCNEQDRLLFLTVFLRIYGIGVKDVSLEPMKLSLNPHGFDTQEVLRFFNFAKDVQKKSKLAAFCSSDS